MITECISNNTDPLTRTYIKCFYKIPINTLKTVGLTNLLFSLFFVVVQLLSCVTPWTVAHQASVSFTISCRLLTLRYTELVLCSPFSSCLQSFPALISLDRGIKRHLNNIKNYLFIHFEPLILYKRMSSCPATQLHKLSRQDCLGFGVYSDLYSLIKKKKKRSYINRIRE